jgi:putative transposase
VENEVAQGMRACGRYLGEPCATTRRRPPSYGAGARHPKKSLGHFQPEDVNEIYAAIDRLEKESLSVALLCKTLNVSRSAYYAWRRDEPSSRRRDDNRLMPMIRNVFWEHKRRYGARRIAVELTMRGELCSRRRVGRLMDAMGLVAIQPKSFKPQTTDSRHALGYSPNLLIDAPPPDGINQLWVGDITYVPLMSGDFLYLALLMDRFSRRIDGWNFQDHMRETLVLQALQAAIRFRQPKPGLIHHTDRGGQYAGAEYRQMLARARMPQSMSRADNCYDNAFMESCFGTIKMELEMEPYQNARIARKELPNYIRYYNTRRRHSALKYMTPEQFETSPC